MIYYTRIGSRIKQPTLNYEATLGQVNWGVMYPESSNKIVGFYGTYCTDIRSMIPNVRPKKQKMFRNKFDFLGDDHDYHKN